VEPAVAGLEEFCDSRQRCWPPVAPAGESHHSSSTVVADRRPERCGGLALGPEQMPVESLPPDVLPLSQRKPLLAKTTG